MYTVISLEAEIAIQLHNQTKRTINDNNGKYPKGTGKWSKRGHRTIFFLCTLMKIDIFYRCIDKVGISVPYW